VIRFIFAYAKKKERKKEVNMHSPQAAQLIRFPTARGLAGTILGVQREREANALVVSVAE
jgi:hypothetical protein